MVFFRYHFLVGLFCIGASSKSWSILQNVSNVFGNNICCIGPCNGDPPASDEWIIMLGTGVDDANRCASLCSSYQNSSLPAGTRCRSFTFFQEDFKNKKMANLCYGHLDPAWTPDKFAGVQSGLIESPCENNLDCSLNGQCMAGSCSCRKGWEGDRCETLSLQPVDRSQMGFTPSSTDGKNYSSWGGSVQQIDGTWHMWAAVMANHCGILGWLMNSKIVHATASNPLGPYTWSENDPLATVFPPFAHEPCVARAPDGELVMACITANLHEGGFNSVCDCNQPDEGKAAGSTTESCKSIPHDINVTLASTSGISAGWTPQLNLGGPSPSADDNLAVHIFANGSLIGMTRGGAVTLATNWKNRSTYTQLPSTMPCHPNLEDPFVYPDEEGNLHALFHYLGEPFTGGVFQAGVHAFSEDGRNWWYGGTCYTNEIEFADGTKLLAQRRERPHLLFNEGSFTPIALSNGVRPDGFCGEGLQCNDYVFTLVQPIG